VIKLTAWSDKESIYVMVGHIVWFCEEYVTGEATGTNIVLSNGDSVVVFEDVNTVIKYINEQI
jgi:uncharacterized protein YlzI (FlbEa/FlbD family)